MIEFVMPLIVLDIKKRDRIDLNLGTNIGEKKWINLPKVECCYSQRIFTSILFVWIHNYLHILYMLQLLKEYNMNNEKFGQIFCEYLQIAQNVKLSIWIIFNKAFNVLLSSIYVYVFFN